MIFVSNAKSALSPTLLNWMTELGNPEEVEKNEREMKGNGLKTEERTTRAK